MVTNFWIFDCEIRPLQWAEYVNRMTDVGFIDEACMEGESVLDPDTTGWSVSPICLVKYIRLVTR